MTASRLAGNIAVLFILLLGAGLAFDVFSVSIGNPPTLSCTFGPLLTWVARALGAVLMAAGLILLLMTRRSRGFVLVLLLGQGVFWLPEFLEQFIAPRC